MTFSKKLTATLLAGATAFGFAAVASAGEYDGITIHVMTRPGKVIAQPLIDRGVEFTKLTGAKVEVAEVPFAELFQKIQTDWTTGTNSIDVGVCHRRLGGRAGRRRPSRRPDTLRREGHQARLCRTSRRISARTTRRSSGKTIGLTIDGDFQMVYYRKDVLDAAGVQPPKTWDEYLEAAKAIHGKDMNGDGEPDYGSCIFKKRNAQSYFAIQTVAARLRADRRARRKACTSTPTR